MFIGLVLLAIGVVALLTKLGVLSGSVWGYFWPIVLIALGLSFILGRFARRGSRMWCGWCWPPRDKDEGKQ
ncbi:MAG: hypothetical protein C4555_01090 [Dehalococcoidia bacterium]|jgi:hypothetical protein|nr:MAG: hypothetical protein C4555_01090 [Dehalococcoidia bacterium]